MTSTGLHLRTVNAQVCSAHTASGEHVGNLKRIGGVWKFKAIGYDTNGQVMPGGGPLTGQHNTVFTVLDDFDLFRTKVDESQSGSSLNAQS